MENMSTDIKGKVFICACHSYNHQAIFWNDVDEDRLIVTIHLDTSHSFFKRLWLGCCYAFGVKSRYGSWDEFIFKPEDEIRLRRYLKAGEITSMILCNLPPDNGDELNGK
jgi:hypothetical protein